MKLRKKILIVLVIIALLALFIKYSDRVLDMANLMITVLRPLALGCVLAYILNIPVSRIESLPVFQSEKPWVKKIKRPISIVGSIVIIAAIIVLITLIVIPQLVQAISVLTKEIPSAISDMMNWLSSSDRDWPRLQSILQSLNVNWDQLLQKLMSHLTNGLSNIFSSTVYVLSSIASTVITFVVALIFSFYLLAGKEKLLTQFQSVAKTYIKGKYFNRISLFLSTAHDTFTKFIVGQCTEAVILGALCTVGMFIFRFPYAAMVGTLVGATALLPVVGAYLGAAVGAFMIFTVNPVRAVAFLIFIVILQQIEGNLIYPRVVGSSVGLPGIWVLCAVTVGGGLNGIIGMLFAVPITATLYKLLQKDVRKKRELVQTSPPTNNTGQSNPPQQADGHGNS